MAGWYKLQHWDGQNWTVWDTGNSPLWDYEGLNALAVALDDTVWLGSNRGLIHFDGTNWTQFDTANSPLPAVEVQGVDVRADGVIGLSCHEFGPITPFPNGIVVIDGAVEDPANWSVFTYGTTPMPHYQLGEAKFDAAGNLWVSTISEGVGKLILQVALPGDGDDDGDVDLDDFQSFSNCTAGPGGAVPSACAVFDFDGDADVDWHDFGSFLRVFASAPGGGATASE